MQSKLRLVVILAATFLGSESATQTSFEEYADVGRRLSASLDACLAGSASWNSDVACNDRLRSQCQDEGPGGETTYGLTACNSVLLKAWDAELNRLWPAVKTMHEDRGSRELLEAQRAWIAFRDAECAFASQRWEGGSMAAYTGGFCAVRMTAERVADFRAFLRER